MKTVIRPETEMKDSGVKYIGLIPRTWKIVQLKYCTDCLDGKRVPIDASLRKSGIYPYWGAGRIMDYVDDYIFDERLVLLGEDGAPFFDDFRPVSHLIDGKVWVNNHIHVLRTKDNVVDSYLVHALNSVDYHEYINGSILNKLTQSNMNRIKIPLPSYIEQQAIADYLDETCSKIDEIIAEAKASIDEYKELKQSVIFEAVTKGLDKNVNVYKTGNSWIPSLPVGIKLSRFGLHHDIILGKMLCPNPRNEEDTLEPYYCAANVHFDGVTGVLKTMWFNSKEKETYVVHKNDMLIVEGGAGAGGAAIMNEEPPVSTFVQNSIMIVRSHMKDNRYSCYLVQALVKNKYVDVVCNKATIPHFTKEKVSYMPYPVFNRNERNEIANYLDERCKQIDSLIAEKESLIHDLEAYKKSLIYEVVTGKRKVV